MQVWQQKRADNLTTIAVITAKVERRTERERERGSLNFTQLNKHQYKLFCEEPNVSEYNSVEKNEKEKEEWHIE